MQFLHQLSFVLIWLMSIIGSGTTTLFLFLKPCSSFMLTARTSFLRHGKTLPNPIIPQSSRFHTHHHRCRSSTPITTHSHRFSSSSGNENETNNKVSSSSSSGKDDFAAPFDESYLISKQNEISSSKLPKSSSSSLNEDEYLTLQRETFDESATFWDDSHQVNPPHLIPVLKHIARRFLRDVLNSKELGLNSRRRRLEEDDDAEATLVPNPKLKLADVGCGTGVMFEYLLNVGKDLGVTLDVVGVDLSPKMVDKAVSFADTLLGTTNETMKNGDSIEVRVGNYADVKDWAKEGEEVEEFDGVLINSCFGNFYDLEQVIATTTNLLKLDGVLSITHPLGSSFVQNLHEQTPETVKHALPTLPQFRSLCRFQPVTIVDYVEQVDLVGKGGDVQTNDLYYAAARKVPHRALERILRFRGIVSEGYGRGGKKLGVPTANLPEEKFGTALRDIDTGVYFGWAVIENDKDANVTLPGRNVFHKTVVNVGYSPTFVGEENKQKIIEAHLIFDDDDDDDMDQTTIPDFYNETMRLALSGYLRPEKKFPSFRDLVRQIHFDIECAKEALGMQPFAALRTDVFLVDPCRRVNQTDAVWVGESGGDEVNSWEFMDQEEVLKEIPLGKFLGYI